MDKRAIGGLALAVIVGFFVVGYASSFVTIDKGHVGVLTWFGKVDDGLALEPGPHLVHPFKRVIRVNVQPQRNEEPATVPTSGGLSVQVKAILVYRIDPVLAPDVLDKIGDRYEEKLIDPYFKNVVRDVCAEYTPEALYTVERNTVETRALARMEKELASRGFVFEQVMLQDPVLPAIVTERIQAKIGAEQDVIRMQSVLKQKELEAQAKVVEAKGIAESQAIIKKDLDQKYLIYQWILAVKEASAHGNKVIYIPTGSDGLPLFQAVDPPLKK